MNAYSELYLDDAMCNLGGMLDTGKQLVQAQSGEHRIQDTGCKAFRRSETGRITFLKRDRVLFRGLCGDIGPQFRDQRIPVPEGLTKPLQVVRLTIVKTIQGTDIQQYFFAGNHVAVSIRFPNCVDKTQIWFSVIFDELNKHANPANLTIVL